MSPTLQLAGAAALAAAGVLVGVPRGRLPVARLSPAPSSSTTGRLDGARGTAIGCVALGAVTGAFLGGATTAIVGALLTAAAFRGARRALRARSAAAQRAVTGDVLAALAAELVAGASPIEALAALQRDLPPPLAADLEGVRLAIVGGGSVAAAWERTALTERRALAATWQVCEVTGAGLAGGLSALAAATEAERRRSQEVELALAGPRSSAVLLTALPALGVLAGTAFGSGTLPFLLHAPVGHALLLVGVLADLAGAAWVGRLSRSASKAPTVR